MPAIKIGGRGQWRIERSKPEEYATQEQVEDFAQSDGPRAARYSNTALSMALEMATRVKGVSGVKVTDAEPVVGWMERMGWVGLPAGRVVLTDYGRKFLEALRAQPTDPRQQDGSVAVLLGPDNPFVYQELTGLVARAGAGLLADPYFKGDQIDWVVNATALTRVLLSDNSRQAREVEQVALALHGLRESPATERLEVRVTSSGEFHDRAVVAADNSLLILGTSLTGIGKHATTVVKLGPVPGNALRQQLERLWSAATTVEPKGIRRAGSMTDAPSDPLPQAADQAGDATDPA